MCVVARGPLHTRGLLQMCKVIKSEVSELKKCCTNTVKQIVFQVAGINIIYVTTVNES